MMSLHRKSKVQTLSEWLEMATKKLAEPSKERIQWEIEAHYTEAMEAHRVNGLSEVDARAAALAQLGDPKAAGRRFRRRHLTERESEWLKKFDARLRKVIWLFGGYVVFCFLTFNSFGQDVTDNSAHAFLLFTLAFTVFVLSPGICFIVARHTTAKPNRFLLALECVNNFLGILLLYQMWEAIGARNIWFLFGMWLLITFRHVWIPLRIWMKLAKTESLWNHNRPADAA